MIPTILYYDISTYKEDVSIVIILHTTCLTLKNNQIKYKYVIDFETMTMNTKPNESKTFSKF
jgi:hypothetical protein